MDDTVLFKTNLYVLGKRHMCKTCLDKLITSRYLQNLTPREEIRTECCKCGMKVRYK